MPSLHACCTLIRRDAILGWPRESDGWQHSQDSCGRRWLLCCRCHRGAGSGSGRTGAVARISSVVRNSVFTSSVARAGCPGGAIYNTGTLVVTTTTFLRNAVSGEGEIGGAIVNKGTLVVTTATFLQNYGSTKTAPYADRGNGAIWNSGNATIRSTVFAGNVASQNRGGAVYSQNGGVVTIFNTTFVGYGIDNSTGTDIHYWVAANSWGVDWASYGCVFLTVTQPKPMSARAHTHTHAHTLMRAHTLTHAIHRRAQRVLLHQERRVRH